MTDRIEQSRNRDRGFSPAEVRSFIADRKKRIAADPGLPAREERENRAKAAKLPPARFPQLVAQAREATAPKTPRANNWRKMFEILQ